MPEIPLSNTPLLDDAQIEMLKETAPDDSAELMIELKGLFDEESQPLLRGLDKGVQQGDRLEIARCSHALAGSSSNIGYLRLAKLVRAFEFSDLSRSIPELEKDLAEIKSVYMESGRAMDALIRDL